jgi:hypothetical protein
MKKTIQITLQIAYKESPQTIEVMNGRPEENGKWILENFPVAGYVSHKLDHVMIDTTEHSNVQCLHETEIQSSSELEELGGSVFHNIKIIFPSIIVSDESKAVRIINAINKAVIVSSQNLYSEGDYSIVKSIQLILAKEINEAYSKAIFRNKSLITISKIAAGSWFVVQPKTNSILPIREIWKEKNCIIS